MTADDTLLPLEVVIAHRAVVSQQALVITPPTITVSTPHRCSSDPSLVFWKESYVFLSVMNVSSGASARPSTSCHASLPRLHVDCTAK